jgi:hypothetical protein
VSTAHLPIDDLDDEERQQFQDETGLAPSTFALWDQDELLCALAWFQSRAQAQEVDIPKTLRKNNGL